MNKRIYGAYGSNMNIEQMQRRCPNAVLIGTGILKDYRLTFRGINNGFANIEKAKGKLVPIVLWELTPECEKALDRYEGFPNFYLKEMVAINDVASLKKAMVYVMTNKYKDLAVRPSDHYFNIIKQGYIKNKIPLSFLDKALAENERLL